MGWFAGLCFVYFMCVEFWCVGFVMVACVVFVSFFAWPVLWLWCANDGWLDIVVIWLCLLIVVLCFWVGVGLVVIDLIGTCLLMVAALIDLVFYAVCLRCWLLVAICFGYTGTCEHFCETTCYLCRFTCPGVAYFACLLLWWRVLMVILIVVSQFVNLILWGWLYCGLLVLLFNNMLLCLFVMRDAIWVWVLGLHWCCDWNVYLMLGFRILCFWAVCRWNWLMLYGLLVVLRWFLFNWIGACCVLSVG